MPARAATSSAMRPTARLAAKVSTALIAALLTPHLSLSLPHARSSEKIEQSLKSPSRA
jgi:hypothetical protein